LMFNKLDAFLPKTAKSSNSPTKQSSELSSVHHRLENIDKIRIPETCFKLSADALAEKVLHVNEAVEAFAESVEQAIPSTFNEDEDDLVDTDSALSRQELLDNLAQAKVIIAEQDQLLKITLCNKRAESPHNDVEQSQRRLDEERKELLISTNRLEAERAEFEKERNREHVLCATPVLQRVKTDDGVATPPTMDSLLVPPTPATKELLKEILG